ncbi:MAG TPA: BolA family protein [Lichenihabitans sp.]|jgi:BolA protein|nr:BolA family protein [Lichenihabitans sp.]
MTVKDSITARLTEALRPTLLDVVDESHLHAGHSGSRPEGETHFRVLVVSQAFAGISRVERHRMVNALLDTELRGPVHALALEARAPDEPGLRTVSPQAAG